MGARGRSVSTNGALNSGKERYSIRALLETAERNLEDRLWTASGSSEGARESR
jgi:hypothetical protein